jgi:hypothetical protein
MGVAPPSGRHPGRHSPLIQRAHQDGENEDRDDPPRSGHGIVGQLLEVETFNPRGWIYRRDRFGDRDHTHEKLCDKRVHFNGEKSVGLR